MYYQRIGHVALRVQNLSASLNFYVNLLGMEKGPCERNQDGEIWIQYVAIAENSFLELFPVKDKPSAAEHYYLHHFCLEVENLRGLVQELKRKNVLCYGGPEELQKKDRPLDLPAVTSSGSLCAWVEDPDGNAVELTELMPDSLLLRFQRQKKNQCQ